MTEKPAKKTSADAPKKAAKKAAAKTITTKSAGSKKTAKKLVVKKLAKIKSTGGYGFTFEDKVAATFFCNMLDGMELLNISKAQLMQVSFQVGAGGWKLDDLLLKLQDDLGSLHCAISVKSAAYLTKNGFKKDFSTDAWSQRLGGAPFDPQRDAMALAVGEMSHEVSVAWTDIERRIVSGTPELLADQLTQEGSSSALERNIFRSLESTQPAPKSPVEAARLLKRIRVRHFGATADTEGIKQCLTLLKVEDPSTASDLWNELQQTASVLRAVGGTIDLDEMLRRLRGKYQLKVHPNYRGDWKVINGFSQSNCDAVHSVAGSDTSIEFAPADRAKITNMPTKQVLGIIGDSGIGKSSLVKSYVESVAGGVNLLWLTHDDLNTGIRLPKRSCFACTRSAPMFALGSTKPPRLCCCGQLFAARRQPRRIGMMSNVLQPYRDLMIRRFFRGHFQSRKYSAAYLLALNHRFARRTLAGTPNWEWHEQRAALMATSTKMFGDRNRLRRVESYMDTEVLRSGFNFLGQFEGLRSGDAPALRAFFQTLMDLEMAVLPDSPDADSDEFQNQYQFDDWLMLLASIYFATLQIEDAMNTVAKPILSLGVGAHAWIADFVKAFFRHAPTLCPTPVDLAERWRALITFVNNSPRWNPENVKLHYYLKQLYRDLFGMSGHPSYAADKGLAAPLLLLRKELGEWCERWLKDPDFVSAFARFLSTAEGREIVSFSLIRLAAALPVMQNGRSRNGDLEDALSAATQHVWKVENDLVRTPGEVSEAFRGLVSFLTARLVPEAISLQAKIAEA